MHVTHRHTRLRRIKVYGTMGEQDTIAGVAAGYFAMSHVPSEQRPKYGPGHTVRRLQFEQNVRIRLAAGARRYHVLTAARPPDDAAVAVAGISHIRQLSH